MLSLDGTFLVMLLSFIAFMLLMKTIYFGPLMAIKHEREGAIEAGREASETAGVKTLQLNREYDQQLTEARRKAQLMVAEKRDIAKGKASERVAQARQQATAEIDTQILRLKDSRDAVYQSLQPERAALAQTILDKLRPSAPSASAVAAATTTSGAK